MTDALPPAPAIRVLVVDDHPMFREGIAELLSRQDGMAVVGIAADGAEAVARFRELAPDVTLMDLQMKGTGGLDAIQQIRMLHGDARILVLTTYSGDANAVRAMRAGACGYLLKNCVRSELIDAIRAAHAGRRIVCSEIAHELAEHALDEPLTDRESTILRLVAEGQLNKQIASRLGLSVDTIKAQLKTIFEKLGVHDRTHAVTVAVRRGYIQR